ncbi:MAG: hypothetical protein RBU28_10685 [Bacteroidales bacterium]|jgi:hypothetical protein|nr:hypothetical protein [Bacteroidales bacterium]
MRYLSSIITLLLIILSEFSYGQYYDTGQDPASLKWMQIKTDRFTVIYPKQYGDQGIEFARTLEESYNRITSVFPDRKFRIPVVIHNFTTQSNGYVAWAPRRMEIYPTPEQNSIPLNPVKYLTIHELTHVMQMESLERGFTKGASFLFGEQFPGVVASLLPLWYLEGDAVYAESVLTESGRGRSPAFHKQLKAISAGRGSMFSYDKIVNGSFRHFVPDHYSSGFHITSWSKYRYGSDLWNDALRLTGNLPFTLNPVNLSLLSTSGVTRKKLFSEAYDTLGVIWKNELATNGSMPYPSLNPPKGRRYISYHSPVKISNTGYVAVRTSMGSPPAIVLIDTEKSRVKKLHSPGQIYPYILSQGRSSVVWVERKNDPRWNNRNYSVIMHMDTRNGKVRQIGRKTRYMAAAVSPDGTTIAASVNSIDNRNSLVFIDISTGMAGQAFTVPGNAYIQKPRWSEDGKEVTFISLTEKGEGIVSFNVNNHAFSTLIEENTDDYQDAFIRNDSLFFVSSRSGTENIYVMSPEKTITRLTASRFGATGFIVDGGKLIFSDYTSHGNDISITDIGSGYEAPSSRSDPSGFISGHDKTVADAIPIVEKNYEPVPYRKFSHLFRFHSWLPFYADLNEITADPLAITPGLTLMSQNTLSTLQTTVGYEYSEKMHRLHSRITWKGWYPVFESEIDYGEDNYIHKLSERIDDPDIINPGMYVAGRAYLPLRFSSGGYIQYFQPSLSFYYANNYIFLKEQGIYDRGQTQLSGRLYFSNYKRSSVRDIYPRFAQIADINYSFYPFEKTIFGSFMTLRTALYVPGLFQNNVIRLKYEWDLQDVEKIPLMNRIDLPRGYRDISSEDLMVFSGSYDAPLVYPDLGILGVVYLTRIRTSLFYDYASGKGNYHLSRENGRVLTEYYEAGTETFSSFGVEMLADFHLFRFPYTLSAGARASWVSGADSPFTEILFSIDVFGMNIGRLGPR